jgi:WD40 repeat protein
VLTSGQDGMLRTWNLSTGKQLRAVRLEAKGETTDATLSADGRKAAAHHKGKIVLWDAETGKETKTLPAPKGESVYLLFSNDGHTLAAWTREWLDLHDLKKGDVRTAPVPPRVSVDSTFHGRFSPDGKHLSLGGGSTAPLSIYDVAKGKELHRIVCHATGSVFSPDGKTLIVSSQQDDAGKSEPSIRVYDVATGKSSKRVTEGIPAYYFTLAFSPDGKRLVCAGHETACVMDARTFAVLRDIPGRVQHPRFSCDGKRIISTNYTRLRFWDPATGKEIDAIEGEFGTTPVIAFSPGGRLLASGDWIAGEIVLWDLKSGRVVRRLALGGEKKYVRTVSFSPDGKTLTATQYKGFIQTWDVATGKEVGSVQLNSPDRPRQQWVYFYTFLLSPDGKTVSTLQQNSHNQKEVTDLCLWDRQTGERLSRQLLPAGTRSAAWRPDGLAVALPLADGLTLLDVKTGKTLWRSAGPVQKPVHASSDFRLIVAGKTKTTVGVYESSTGKEVGSLDVSTFAHIALASDNRTLVITDAERIRVVDLASGKEIRSHALPVVMKTASGATFANNLTLTPDAGRAFTAHADGTGLVWDIAWRHPARIATGKDLAAWWVDLASPDAARAWRATWALTDAKASAFVKKRLRDPGPDAPPKNLIDALDADSFEERESAEKALAKRGSDIVPALRLARDKATSPEQRRRLDRLIEKHGPYTADRVRRLRAAGVLEMIERGQP